MLNHPGVCAVCYTAERLADADRRLARATTSIHPERRWAHLDSGLMAERLNSIAWGLYVGGKLQDNGVGYESIRTLVSGFDMPRLIVTGTESGIGKTSLAVAMMQDALTEARKASFNGSGDATEQVMSFAENARFVASIDIGDPLSVRSAHVASLAVIDDAGQEGRCGGWKGQERYAIMGDLLDRRERNPKRKTIVTTFGTREQWGTWYGGRVTRLYWDMPTSAVLEMMRRAA